jgi:uncharacterized SAM-dependent methyltransferase
MAEIVDVHTLETSEDLRQQIIDGLKEAPGHKTLPTMLLYDERGLRLYDDITTKAPEYYLFSAEEDILKNHATEIVLAMHNSSGLVPGETVIELGAGYDISVLFRFYF